MGRRPYLALAAAACLALLLVMAGSAGRVGRAAQSEPNRAGLVVQFEDGSTSTFCVPFEGDSISGLDLLLRSGLEVKAEVQGGMGALVCAIGPTGCAYPAEPCLCRGFGPEGVYWSYHHLQDGKWRASVAGAGSYRVRPGMVEGWRWSSGAPPPLHTFSDLCPAIEPAQPSLTPLPTPEPPSPPTSTRTRSPIPPSSTPRPSKTPAPPAVVPATPTEAAPEPPGANDTPGYTPMPTETGTAQPTATSTSTSTASFTPASTATSSALPTRTQAATGTATPGPAAPSGAAGSGEDVARAFGLAIGGTVVAALAGWGLLNAVRRRRPGAGGGG